MRIPLSSFVILNKIKTTSITNNVYLILKNPLFNMLNNIKNNKELTQDNILIGVEAKYYLNNYKFDVSNSKHFTKEYNKTHIYEFKEQKHHSHSLSIDEYFIKHEFYLNHNPNRNLTTSIYPDEMCDFINKIKTNIDRRITGLTYFWYGRDMFDRIKFLKKYNPVNTIDVEIKIKVENIIGLIDYKNKNMCDTIIMWINHSKKEYTIMYELDKVNPYHSKKFNYSIDNEFIKKHYKNINFV